MKKTWWSYDELDHNVYFQTAHGKIVRRDHLGALKKEYEKFFGRKSRNSVN